MNTQSLSTLISELRAADEQEQHTRTTMMSRRWFIRAFAAAAVVADAGGDTGLAGQCATNTEGCTGGTNLCGVNTCNGVANTCSEQNKCNEENICQGGSKNTCSGDPGPGVNSCYANNTCGQLQGSGNVCRLNVCYNKHVCQASNVCNGTNSCTMNTCSAGANTCNPTSGNVQCPHADIPYMT